MGPLFKAGLEAAGFEVNLFDNQQLDFQEVFEAGVEDLGNKFDLALYVANVETASNQTTVRLDWNHLMAANAPWYEKDLLPFLFLLPIPITYLTSLMFQLLSMRIQEIQKQWRL